MPLSKEAATRKDNSGEATTPLQHRHFKYIAAIIRDMPDSGYRADVALHFADKLKHSNPNFDAARFLAAAVGGVI